MNAIRAAAMKALEPINGTIEVSVKNPTGSRLEIGIVIKLPTKEGDYANALVFLLSREGLHWYYQLFGDDELEGGGTISRIDHNIVIAGDDDVDAGDDYVVAGAA
jgi:hypothetical protein